MDPIIQALNTKFLFNETQELENLTQKTMDIYMEIVILGLNRTYVPLQFSCSYSTFSIARVSVPKP